MAGYPSFSGLAELHAAALAEQKKNSPFKGEYNIEKDAFTGAPKRQARRVSMQMNRALDEREQRGSDEQALIDAMRAQMTQGAGPSAAEIQQQQGLEAAMRAQMAAAASARGISPAQAAQLAAEQGGQIQLQGVADAARLRAEEVAAARGQQLQAGSILGQALANEQAQLDQMTQYYTSMGLSWQDAAIRASQDLERMKLDYAAAEKGFQVQKQMADDANSRNFWGGLINTAGNMVGLGLVHGWGFGGTGDKGGKS